MFDTLLSAPFRIFDSVMDGFLTKRDSLTIHNVHTLHYGDIPATTTALGPAHSAAGYRLLVTTTVPSARPYPWDLPAILHHEPTTARSVTDNPYRCCPTSYSYSPGQKSSSGSAKLWGIAIGLVLGVVVGIPVLAVLLRFLIWCFTRSAAKARSILGKLCGARGRKRNDEGTETPTREGRNILRKLFQARKSKQPNLNPDPEWGAWDASADAQYITPAEPAPSFSVVGAHTGMLPTYDQCLAEMHQRESDGMPQQDNPSGDLPHAFFYGQ
jgi:hypothetical protein